MASVRLLWLLLCLAWVTAEIKLAKSKPIEAAEISETEDYSRRILWLTIVTSVIGALAVKSLSIAPIPISYLPRQLVGLLVVLTGLVLRFIAIKQLGCLFTTNVAIFHEHVLIKYGPYRHIRHPAYTGLIIAFFGAGLAMGDYIALFLLTIPLFFALDYRIVIEEKLLLKKFGAAYQGYVAATNKLFPRIKAGSG